MLVILASIILTGFGVLALKQIPIDAFPDVTNVQVQVLATAGGMSPPEVEKLVTRPIEIELGGSAAADRDSVGFENRLVRDHHRVRGRRERLLRAPACVRTTLKRARRTCRRDVDVELGPITTGLGEIFQYTLVSKDKKYDATELRTIQDYIVRPILAHGARRHGREFLRRTGEAIPGDHQTRSADFLRHHAAASRSRRWKRTMPTRVATSSSTSRSNTSCAGSAW